MEGGAGERTVAIRSACPRFRSLEHSAKRYSSGGAPASAQEHHRCTVFPGGGTFRLARMAGTATRRPSKSLIIGRL